MARSRSHAVLANSERFGVPGAKRVRDVPDDEEMHLSVYVRRNPDAPSLPDPDEIGSELPGRRTPISEADLDAATGAAQTDIDKVVSVAQRHNLRVDEADARKRRVRVSGTYADITKVFQPEDLAHYESPGHSFRGRTGHLYVSRELGRIVEAVYGFDTRRVGRSRLVGSGARVTVEDAAAAQVSLPPGTRLPPALGAIYSFPTAATGKGQTVAILAFNEPDSHGGYNKDALQLYFERVLGQRMPSISDVVVHGQGNDPGDDSGLDPADTTGEVMLDIQVVGGLVPDANLVMYFTQFTEQGWVDVIYDVITDTANAPKVISISYGNPEDDPRSAWTVSGIGHVNEAFRAAALRGITIMAASGDDGSRDQAGGLRAHADFPASSPYVLGVGGTTLVTFGAAVLGEVVWGRGPRDATGGGVSALFPLPAWQGAVGVPRSANPDHHVGRGVPDVAAVADPRTGVAIITVDARHLAGVGGTSASAPLWAALVARLNETLGSPLGYFNPLLYQSLAIGVLRDVVSGSNGAYFARPGWDACTGLGTPDGQRLLSALSGAGPPPPAGLGPFADAVDALVQGLWQAWTSWQSDRASADAYDRYLEALRALSAGQQAVPLETAYSDFQAALSRQLRGGDFLAATERLGREYADRVQRAFRETDASKLDAATIMAITQTLYAASAQLMLAAALVPRTR